VARDSSPFISSLARRQIDQRIGWMRRVIVVLLVLNVGQAVLLYLCCR
jgi:hypothetical protein